MKLKKVIAAIAATAVAASMTAVNSFAAANIGMEGYTLSDDYGDYMDMVQMYSDVASVATCEITVTDSEANGCVAIASESTAWAWAPVDSSTATDNGDGTFTYSVPCTLAATDSMVKITVQDWDEATTLAVVSKIVLKDASGNVLVELPASASNDEGGETTEAETTEAETTEAETTAAETAAESEVGATENTSIVTAAETAAETTVEETTADTTAAADSSTGAAKTGNVPVAVMASVMALTGAAVIVSRKRK